MHFFTVGIGQTEMIELFILWEADVNTSDKEGDTVLLLAEEVETLRIVEILMVNGTK